jgi:hypothetical protein
MDVHTLPEKFQAAKPDKLQLGVSLAFPPKLHEWIPGGNFT